MNLEELKALIAKRGLDWLIAAMVEGSIGYHSPKHAKRIIEEALEGKTQDYCERCMACYGSDLFKMIESDIRDMEYLEEKVPSRYQKVIETVKAISSLDAEGQQTAGLMYPTMGM
ncbi:MAG: hypothetical protein OIN86_10240 [Candidatus Methanoperedens sp.]|nr:hypothetical protein [Candidatus Methanoperedens sp.]CAG0971052.1 hypothetical protein METP1_01244 [Methanosarcinales archaeon]